MKKSILLLTLSLLLSAALSAQTATKVIVEAGADKATTQQLQIKIESLLQSVNELIVNGNDTFPKEPGVPVLKELVSSQQLISTQDTLGTLAIRHESDWELSRIFLQKKGGKAWDSEELVFTFDKNLRLKAVEESEPERNINRMLLRDI